MKTVLLTAASVLALVSVSAQAEVVTGFAQIEFTRAGNNHDCVPKYNKNLQRDDGGTGGYFLDCDVDVFRSGGGSLTYLDFKDNKINEHIVEFFGEGNNAIGNSPKDNNGDKIGWGNFGSRFQLNVDGVENSAKECTIYSNIKHGNNNGTVGKFAENSISWFRSKNQFMVYYKSGGEFIAPRQINISWHCNIESE